MKSPERIGKLERVAGVKTPQMPRTAEMSETMAECVPVYGKKG